MSGSAVYKSTTIPFVVVYCDEGFFADRSFINEEELTTPGVSGARWRTIYEQFPDFTVRTVTQATTVANAISYKRLIERVFPGKNMTLSATINGTNYTMKNAHVKAARATVVPGPLHGVGVSNANAHVITQWVIKATDFDAQ